MVFYTQTNDKNSLLAQSSMLKSIVKYSLEFQKQKRKLLRQCLDKICFTIESLIDISNVNILFNVLENLKASISASDFNITKFTEIEKVLDKLDDMIFFSTTDSANNMYKNLNAFNDKYSSIEETIIQNTNIIDNFLLQFFQNCSFHFDNSLTIEPITSTESENIQNIKTNDSENPPEISDEKSENLLSDSKTLLISEKDKKVYLPYCLEDVLEMFNDNPGTYISLEDVISKEYTLPLSRYKNPIVSRFKEAFNLMKYKEEASFFKSFHLAMELSHNSSLNPAIITACKNLDELNTYLDCLASNELDKFSFFHIIFDVLPTKK